MSIWRLVAREIGYRRLNFSLAALAVLVAVGTVVGVLTLLKGHRLRAERIAEAQSERAGRIGFELKDDARRITKDLGYNILILPKDQNLAEFYTSGGASKTMPIEYAQTLADSRIVIVRHLLACGHEAHVVLPMESELSEHYRQIGAHVHIIYWQHLRKLSDPVHVMKYLFWLAPTTQIVDQTVKALRDKRHPYRQAMDADFCPSARRRWK